MKIKSLLFLTITFILVTNACSPLRLTDNLGQEPASPSTRALQLSYIGQDGNVWFHVGVGSEPRQITTDAFHNESNDTPGGGIAYYFPRMSSDGEWIAYRRDVTKSGETGMQYSSGLSLSNLKTNEVLQVLEQIPAGFAWKPGTHVLAYGFAVPEGYFGGAEDPIDETLARGIKAFNADTRETVDLVEPERGYALYSPQWSPDGQLLGFDELVYMEGRGNFAYYDFEKGSYVAWDEPIGNYIFSPDRAHVIYDRLTYVPQGTEDVFIKPLRGGSEQRLIHYPSDKEYAFSPVVSPSGDRIAYLASLDGPDSQKSALFIRELKSGELTLLGKFDMVLNLAWSPDGSRLVFSAGPWDAQKVLAVNASDGSTTVLGIGTTPDVNR